MLQRLAEYKSIRSCSSRRVKIRDEGFVRNKVVHIALVIQAKGTKEISDLWLEHNEGTGPAPAKALQRQMRVERR